MVEYFKPDGSIEYMCHSDSQKISYPIYPRTRYEDFNKSNVILPDPPESELGLQYQKVYNSANRLSLEGEFKNRMLYTGKKYIYNKYGLLRKIEVYKKGKYFADAQLE